MLLSFFQTMEYLSILMPTYNSSKFLKEQLESIINQTFKNWKLIIRDDGSTDNTLEILKEYVVLDKRIIIFEDNEKHLGAKNSFFKLLESVDSEYYMFCDHDDVWLEDKICITLERILSLKNKKENLPIIVHTDLIVVDSDLDVLYPSFWKFSNFDLMPSFGFKFHCAYNNVTGCTMLINRLARDLTIHPPKAAYMHDSWISLKVAYHKGIIDYIPKATILYRQHNENTFGAKRIPTIVEQFKNFKDIFNRNKDQIKAINTFYKMSYLHFFCNKLYFNLYFRLKIGIKI